jgi:hypothetical protein
MRKGECVEVAIILLNSTVNAVISEGLRDVPFYKIERKKEIDCVTFLLEVFSFPFFFDINSCCMLNFFLGNDSNYSGFCRVLTFVEYNGITLNTKALGACHNSR